MHKGRILVVDDESGIRFSLRGILEDEGFAVAEAVGIDRSSLYRKLKGYGLTTD